MLYLKVGKGNPRRCQNKTPAY